MSDTIKPAVERITEDSIHTLNRTCADLKFGDCAAMVLYGLLEIADAIRSLRPTNYTGVK